MNVSRSPRPLVRVLLDNLDDGVRALACRVVPDSPRVREAFRDHLLGWMPGARVATRSPGDDPSTAAEDDPS